MENSMGAPQNIKNRIIIWSNNSTLEYIFLKNESRISKIKLSSHVNSNVIQNSLKVETTQVFTWMDR